MLNTLENLFKLARDRKLNPQEWYSVSIEYSKELNHKAEEVKWINAGINWRLLEGKPRKSGLKLIIKHRNKGKE